MGTFGTLVGIGGGIVLVPVFLLILHYPPEDAVGTALTVVFFNALSGTAAYIRQKKVYYEAAIRFSLATLPGAVLGSYLSHFFTHRGFSISFGILLILIAIFLYTRPHGAAELACEADPSGYNRFTGTWISTLVGFFSSVFGIGGGIVHVPAMICLLGFPVHMATATSHFILTFSALFGVISHFLLGNVLVTPALIIGGGAVIGAQIGAYLSPKVKSQAISLLLCAALLLVGLRMILK